VAVATVVFPLISQYAAVGDVKNLAGAYRKGMRFILVINIPAAFGLAILASPIIRVILQHGRFAAADTAMMTPVLIANAAGLPFLSFASLALRAFYAQKDTVVPVRAAVLSFVVNVGLSLALMIPFSTVGLALASSIAAAVQAVYLQWHLARKSDELAFHHLLVDCGKVICASAVMGLVVGAAWWGWLRLMPRAQAFDLAGIAVAIVGGVAVYAALAWLLRVEGRDDVAALLTKARRKFAPPAV
jgi:putative peptidoglycan lipid II flippase